VAREFVRLATKQTKKKKSTGLGKLEIKPNSWWVLGNKRNDGTKGPIW